MDRITHKRILAETYGCRESELLAQFDNMMPQIRNSAIVTLSIDKKVTASDVPVMA